MKIRYQTIIYLLFFIFIITLPVNSYQDTVAFFKGTLGDKTRPLTPYAFKVFKDIFLVGCIVLVAVAGGLRYVRRDILPYYLFLILAVVFAGFSATADDALAIFIAIRSYLVVFFIFLGFHYYKFDTIRLYPLLRFIFWIELGIQILQFLYAPPYYGLSYHGFNLANPGTFLIPSTMASFAILIHYFAIKKGDSITVVLSLISVFLSKSSTAWIILIFFYFLIALKSFRVAKDAAVFLLMISGILLFLNLETVTGRETIVDINLMARLEIFLDHLGYPLGKGFGLGSGGAVLMQVEDSVIADSTVNSLLINFGWTGFLIYGLFIMGSFRAFDYRDLLLLSFVGFSLTMIIFEMTPFIQFYFFEMGRRFRLGRDPQPASELSLHL